MGNPEKSTSLFQTHFFPRGIAVLAEAVHLLQSCEAGSPEMIPEMLGERWQLQVIP